MATATLLVTEAVYMANTLVTPVIFLSSGLIKSIKYIMTISHADNELQQILSNTDIVKDIEVIKSIVTNQPENTISNPSIQLCLKHLTEILSEIESLLKTISAKLARHHKKWFHSIRQYNISTEKDQLMSLIRKLHHRFELYIKCRGSVIENSTINIHDLSRSLSVVPLYTKNEPSAPLLKDLET